MQKPEQEYIVDEQNTVDAEEEQVEVQEPDEPRRRSRWNYVIWTAVVLVILAFAVFGITTLMHHPPTIEKDNGYGFVHGLSYAAMLVNAIL